MQTKSNGFKPKENESPLVSLIEKRKEAFEGVSLMRLIRRDFEMVEEAREAGITWAEIAEAYGHPGKTAQARYAYFYERRRRANKGGLKPAAQPAPKIENGKQEKELVEKRTIHMIPDEEEKGNLFERSKLY
ncbi:hypothetical protein [Leptospirillum sp. Group II 'CF-1']|jgi:hypothetical protein|uniref:hypothetical protein n=1 Tax=Leptospirillum sp. Group II 'CF-1' TaxID=1660083 RepID=UPI000A86203B|nr:hypothetical protein [Leptospirillum sp. Group II 'CF-1']